jgi:hypothetical protein
MFHVCLKSDTLHEDERVLKTTLVTGVTMVNVDSSRFGNNRFWLVVVDTNLFYSFTQIT